MKKEKEKDRKYKIFIIIALVISIFAISVGYASFSNLLEVNNDVYLKGKDWLIKFDNLSNIKTTGKATILTNPVITNNIIDTDISFEEKGDSIEYNFDVVNAGNLHAKLSVAPSIRGIPAEEADNIKYTIKYEDGTDINEGDFLATNTSKKIKVIIEYTANNITEEMPSREFMIITSLFYIQA